MGFLLQKMKDSEGALVYYQQALSACERVLGNTHPDTLNTVMNIVTAHKDGLKDFAKAEEMHRLALDCPEKSLRKDHKKTKSGVQGT